MNINRLIYPGFWFGKSKTEDALEMARRGAGGFCIYGGTRQEIAALTDALKKASPLPHVFICADYEDGLGRWINGEDWVLSNLAIGAAGSEETAYQKGLTLSHEARRVGVDWVFAPVLDLCNEPQNPIVNTRSFGADPDAVGRLGAALCQGLNDGGVLNSIKHFPGHGSTKTDSHLALPVLTHSLQQLQAQELIPFRLALAKANSVMAGHLFVPALDKTLPASQSRAVLTGLLKEQLGFKGLILTDALNMKSAGDVHQTALNALHAGAHILLSATDAVGLSDFLQTQPGLEEIIRQSTALQDALILHHPQVKNTGLPAAQFNQTYAAACAVWQGQTLALHAGDEIDYLELGNEEAFAAQAFLHALEKRGIRVSRQPHKTHTLVAVSFSNYKAFKGHINLSAEEKQQLAEQARAHDRSIFVSFGSPFGTEDIAELTARLFLFSPAQQAQTTAADIVCALEKPTGRMPV